jgi:hypothetical protein
VVAHSARTNCRTCSRAARGCSALFANDPLSAGKALGSGVQTYYDTDGLGSTADMTNGSATKAEATRTTPSGRRRTRQAAPRSRFSSPDNRQTRTAGCSISGRDTMTRVRGGS